MTFRRRSTYPRPPKPKLALAALLLCACSGGRSVMPDELQLNYYDHDEGWPGIGLVWYLSRPATMWVYRPIEPPEPAQIQGEPIEIIAELEPHIEQVATSDVAPDSMLGIASGFGVFGVGAWLVYKIWRMRRRRDRRR